MSPCIQSVAAVELRHCDLTWTSHLAILSTEATIVSVDVKTAVTACLTLQPQSGPNGIKGEGGRGGAWTPGKSLWGKME